MIILSCIFEIHQFPFSKIIYFYGMEGDTIMIQQGINNLSEIKKYLE